MSTGATNRCIREAVAMAMTVAMVIAGCGGPSISPASCPGSVDVTKPPPGVYIHQHAIIDYDRLVPPGDSRRNVDQAYSRQVVEESVLLEQVYYDATHGSSRAAWLVCNFEETARSSGRQVARYLASLRCQTIASCNARWDELPISRDTASGQRLLSVLAAGFDEEARKLELESELVANVMILLVGTPITARASLARPRPASTSPAGGTSTRVPPPDGDVSRARVAGGAQYGSKSVGAAERLIHFGEGIAAGAATFHSKIKPAILRAAGRFQGKVGKNPDIKVVGGKIQLQGTGPFKGKKLNTELRASDIFGRDQETRACDISTF